MSRTPKNGPNSGVTHPKRTGQKSGPLSVLEYLRQGLGPSDIWKSGLLPERTVKRGLSQLRSVGLIKKVGYGTWEIIDQDNDKKRTGQLVHRVTQPPTPDNGPKNGPIMKPDTVRQHGIVATVKVNRARFITWDDRHIVLDARKIPYTTIPQGQRIKVLDVEKVWLTSKSIVYYLPYSWFGETVTDCAAKAIEDVIRLTLRLERMLGIDTLKIHGSYWIKFSRQHDSLIKNALAEMYNHPRQRIQFRDELGQWALIDNSWNLEEFETTRGEKEYRAINPNKPILPQVKRDDKGAREHNRKVQKFMTGVKDTGITPEFILESLNSLTKQSDITQNQLREAHSHLAVYAKELDSHALAWNELGRGARENTKTTASLREAVAHLAETMRTFSMPVKLPEQRYTLAPKKVDKTPSPFLGEKLVEKKCGLCGTIAQIPDNRGWCDKCDKVVGSRKGKLTASLNNFMGGI